MAGSLNSHPARFWHTLEDGRIQCDLCPRFCRLHEGQRAFCFVRARQGDQMVLTTYGRFRFKSGIWHGGQPPVYEFTP